MKKSTDTLRDKIIRTATKGAMRQTMDPTPFGWPPASTGYFKQSKRPEALRKESK